jgi:hypothetical protein
VPVVLPAPMPSDAGASVAIVAAPTVCPRCGSSLLQPLRWETRAKEEVLIDLRCPECFAWMQGLCTPAEIEELDRLQAGWREQIVAAYERSVAESMEALAALLAQALALDLVGPDDFAPRRRLRAA